MKLTHERWQLREFLETRLGLVVFDEDPVSGPTTDDLLRASGIRTQVARLPLPATDDTPDDLARALAVAAATILPSDPPPVIAFACTTGAMQLGPDRLREAVSRAGRAITPVTPLDSAVAALRHLGAGTLAMVSPYDRALSESIATHLERDAGVAVADLTYFEAGDEAITSIAHESIIAAALACQARAQADALFLSCTGMRATPLIERLEAQLGIPVLTSLQVMAWHSARLLGRAASGPGRLLGRPDDPAPAM